MIIGLAGAIGTGKSFTQLKQALQYAEDREKQLVFNFEINIKELHKYASMPVHANSFFSHTIYQIKYAVAYYLNKAGLKTKLPNVSPRMPWIKRLCEEGGIAQIPAPKYLEALLIPESVVCLDEAGILLNSREFAKTSKELLADLAQSRKDGCDLFWAAQFDEQVDRQLRLLTQYWIHCDSVAVYDKVLRRPRLFWKKIYWFRAADYMYWQQNARDRGSHLKARFAYSFKYEGGILSPADKQLFNVFNSFSRLDKSYSGAKIYLRSCCLLPRLYYIQKLENYKPFFDPFSKYYQRLYGYFGKKNKLQTIKTYNFTDRSSLIKKALSIARAKRISAPYFKDMKESEIKAFISSNS